MSIPIPKASARAFSEYKAKTPQNPGLIFDRFAPDWGSQATLKKEGLEEVRVASGKAERELLVAWNERWESSVQENHALSFALATDWRLIAGLGRKGSYEVGFTFHRYGFPYLPGSSVKGIARSWALFKLAEEMQIIALDKLDEILETGEANQFLTRFGSLPGAEKGLKLAEEFRTIFGTTSSAGLAIFFDAIPDASRLPVLELDIMNPHYPKYYEGSEPPTDWQSPIPVYFLAVASGTGFRFAVGWNGEMVDIALQQKAQEWLKEALLNIGAGGKTSAGYGYFSVPIASQPMQAAQQPRSSSQLPPGYRAGTVSRFGLGEKQSYGFIQPDGGVKEVFVHMNQLSGGLHTLSEGQRVMFKIEQGLKGPQAVDVRPL